MPSNNSKYTQEMREQTVKLIIETGNQKLSPDIHRVNSSHVETVVLLSSVTK